MNILRLADQPSAEQPQYQMEYDSLMQDLTKHKMNCQNLMASSTIPDLKRKYEKITRKLQKYLIELAEI